MHFNLKGLHIIYSALQDRILNLRRDCDSAPPENVRAMLYLDNQIDGCETLADKIMTGAKHPSDSARGLYAVADCTGVYIAAVPDVALERDRLKKSNAELLEALEAMVDMVAITVSRRDFAYSLSSTAFDNARTAIAKAKGTP